jgi:hypothetical protein
MRFSPLLRLPRTYVCHEQPVAPVHYVHGTGGAIRRSAIERYGGWDEDTPIEDEVSFGLRLQLQRAPGHYLAFDPRPLLRRRGDLEGGLGKRQLTAAGFYRKAMTFVHRVLGRYHPVRVRLLYPLYALAALAWTLNWVWGDSRRHSSTLEAVGGSLKFLAMWPLHTLAMVREPLGRREHAKAPASFLPERT